MMSMPSTSRSTAPVVEGAGANGSTASTARLGHRQGHMSRASIAPSDSVSQAGGIGVSRSTSKVLSLDPRKGLIDRDNRG